MANQSFIRLRQNTLEPAPGMNDKVNSAIAHQSKPTSRRSGAMSCRKGGGGLASTEFRFDTPRLAAWNFINYNV